MAFNNLRLNAALSVRKAFGVAAVHAPKAGAPKNTIVVVHRARSIVRPTRNDGGYVNQPHTTATIFRVGDEFDIESVKNGETLTLAETGEVLVIGTALESDEYKTKLAVTTKRA